MRSFAQFSLLAIALLLSAVWQSSLAISRQQAGAGRAYREVTDEAGRAVRLVQPVERIVSLAPSITETIYALGLEDHLAGDTDYCEYPAAAKQKPKVGGTINPSIEAIAALHPDVVVVTAVNRWETVHALEQLNIPVYSVDPQTVDQITASTRRLAEALGYPASSSSVTADMERRLAELHRRLKNVVTKQVLFIVWQQPLISVGKNTFIADALRHAAAESIVDSSQKWPQMSLEEVVKLQPEFLISAASHTGEGTVNPDALGELPGWRSLEAVKKRKFVLVDESIDRPSPAIVNAIEELARKLHPEAFAEKSHTAPGEPRSRRMPAAADHSARSCACAR
jgi:iron complex transport system substrate-binding protein